MTDIQTDGQLKLNLGCGRDIRVGFVNVDMHSSPGVDLVCDVVHLPMDDGTVDEIIANDILEHFPFSQTIEILKEWRRVLADNGSISIRVPNLEGLFELYRERPKGWRREDVDVVDPIVQRLFGGQDYEGNYHYTTFDRSSLWAALEKSGFFVMEIADDGLDRSNIVAKGLAQTAYSVDKVFRINEKPGQNLTAHDLRITWEGPCFGMSGYAYAAREYITGLADYGVSICAKPIWGDCRVDIGEQNRDSRGGVETKAVVNGEICDVRIHTPVETATAERIADLSTKPFGGVYVLHHPPVSPEGRNFIREFKQANSGMTAYVAYTTFETDRLPENWIDPLNRMDEVWVPCRFNADTFARAGVDKDKLHVIPHGFDPERYRPEEALPLKYVEEAGFVFLSIFEWTKRKGWDVLLRAYFEEFRKTEDVCLLIRTYQGGGVIGENQISIQEQFERFIAENGFSPEELPAVKFIEEKVPDAQMSRLYKTGNAFVLPTRGEGWGIPLCESMLMEVPVISTRWGGSLEFMNDENSYPIDVQRVEKVSDEQVRDNAAYSGHMWAEPSIGHTKALMRHVFEHREEASEKGRRGRRFILENFTKIHAATKIAARIKSLSKNYAPFRGKEKARVLFQGRENAFWLPGGDTEVMVRLKAELERKNIRVDFSHNCEEDLSSYDLVHVFNYSEPSALNAAGQKTPFVITPMHENTGLYARAAMETITAFRQFLMDKSHDRLKASIANIANIPATNSTASFDFTYSAADAILVSGEEEANQLKEKFVDLGPLLEVPLGFTRSRNANEIGPELFVEKYGVKDFVLCVGRLESRKNQLMLLYALRDDDIPVVLINSPSPQPEYEEMCRLIERKGRTIITGRVSEEMLLSAYAAAKVHALPSWYELPGLVTLEAAWQGCNIVASDWGTIRDYLKEEAFYCHPAEPGSIRTAVADAMNRPKTDLLRNVVDVYSWEKEGCQVEKIYKEAIKNSQSDETRKRRQELSEGAEKILGRLEQRREAFELADKNPLRAIKIANEIYMPGDTVLDVTLGTAHLMLQNFEQSEVYFTRLVSVNPHINPRYYLYLCLVLERQNKFKELTDVAEQCMRLNPFMPEKASRVVAEYRNKGTAVLGRRQSQGGVVYKEEGYCQ